MRKSITVAKQSQIWAYSRLKKILISEKNVPAFVY